MLVVHTNLFHDAISLDQPFNSIHSFGPCPKRAFHFVIVISFQAVIFITSERHCLIWIIGSIATVFLTFRDLRLDAILVDAIQITDTISKNWLCSHIK